MLFPLSGSLKFKWSFYEISVKINAAFSTFAELQCNLFTNLVFLILSGTAKLPVPLVFIYLLLLIFGSCTILCPSYVKSFSLSFFVGMALVENDFWLTFGYYHFCTQSPSPSLTTVVVSFIKVNNTNINSVLVTPLQCRIFLIN